ncbi:MAG: DoxX family protein [Pseudomonadota bacterium]
MGSVTELYDRITDRLRAAGDWVAPLGLRFLLAYEFWSAGSRKLSVEGGAPNWFANTDFPAPFGWLSADLNWLMVTWGEVLAAVALLLGLFTRFFAFSLLVITTIACVSVHWPESWSGVSQLWEGYSVSRVVEDGTFRGNFRIPLLFLAMTLPLIFFGGGKLSLDHALIKVTERGDLTHDRRSDWITLSLALFVPGVVLLYLIPVWGIVLLLGAAAAAVYQQVKG